MSGGGRACIGVGTNVGSDLGYEKIVDAWMANKALASVLAGWKPVLLIGHAEANSEDLMHKSDTSAEGKRFRIYLQVVECARCLRPQAIPNFDMEALQEQLKAWTHAEVGIPSDLKQAILAKALQDEVTRILDSDANKYIASTIIKTCDTMVIGCS